MVQHRGRLHRERAKGTSERWELGVGSWPGAAALGKKVGAAVVPAAAGCRGRGPHPARAAVLSSTAPALRDMQLPGAIKFWASVAVLVATGEGQC